MTPPRPQLIILAPAHELENGPRWQPIEPGTYMRVGDTPYSDWVEEFVDEGVHFPFDQHQGLPAELPENLQGVRCVMIDAQRREQFEQAPLARRLEDFQRQGGYVLWAGSTGHTVRTRVLRAIATAGLVTDDPAMHAALEAIDEQTLVNFWRDSAHRQIRLLMDKDAGWAWGDPVAYHFYWPMEAASEYFADPSWQALIWETVAEGLDTARWPRPVGCGARFALKYAQHTDKQDVIERIVRERREGTHWRMQDMMVNMDLRAPAGAEVNDPPAMVRDNLWAWPEVSGAIGDTLGYLSKVTGDMSHAQRAVRQVCTQHEWSFDPQRQLWFHVGRPEGPDLRSAPWGRGNGWMLYGIRGLLEDLPENHPARLRLSTILGLHLEGLLRWQTESGLWCNVLDARPDESRTETAGAWMIINTYARAYWKGWLRDPRMVTMCEQAWKGLKRKIWRGLPISHCEGTPYMLRRQGYLERQQHRFIAYPLLLAMIEIRRMREAT